MKQWLIKNKVFIIGLLLALVTTISEIADKGDHASLWVIAWSAAIAGLTFAGRNLRGQTASIITALGTTAYSFFNLHESPNDLAFAQIMRDFVFPLTILTLGIFNSSPPKTVEYEKSPTITEAKVEARTMIANEKESDKLARELNKNVDN